MIKEFLSYKTPVIINNFDELPEFVSIQTHVVLENKSHVLIVDAYLSDTENCFDSYHGVIDETAAFPCDSNGKIKSFTSIISKTKHGKTDEFISIL